MRPVLARATGRCEGSGGQRHREVRADVCPRWPHMTRGQGQAQSSHLDFSLRASACVEVGLPRLLPLLASSSLVCTSRSLAGG